MLGTDDFGITGIQFLDSKGLLAIERFLFGAGGGLEAALQELEFAHQGPGLEQLAGGGEFLVEPAAVPKRRPIKQGGPALLGLG